MSEVEIVTIAADQVSTTGAVLARAFHDDPLTGFMIPDPSERAAALPRFYEASVRVARRFGEALTTRESAGAALWFPPSRREIGSEHFEAAGVGDVFERLPVGAFDRFLSLLEYLEALRLRDVPEPHWYLAVLGVEPSIQGKGIGSRLLRPILARADSSGVPCYLETQKASNVPLYRHFGFDVVVESTEANSGIRFWTMLRRPAAAGSEPASLAPKASS